MKSVSAKVERRGPARHRLGPPRLLRDLAVGRKGAVVIIVAVAMIPLLLAAGGAIDVARFYVAKSRVQYALDAALLAAGASDPAADRGQIFSDYFKANSPETSVGAVSYEVPDWADPTLSELSVSATLQVPTVFLHLAAIDELKTTIAARIVRTTTGLELALVLDTTGSMLDAANSTDATTKLDNLKTAAGELLSIVFDGQETSHTIKVALVPFVTAVNIGTANASYVKFPTTPHQNVYPDPIEFSDAFDISWKGCVLARRDGNDVLDTFTANHTTAGEWEPYFWEAEGYFKTETSPLQSTCPNRWWRPNGVGNPPLPRATGRFSDPVFLSTEGSFTDPGGGALIDPDPDSGGPAGSALLPEGETRGPNRSCPSPISPLTNERATIQTAIDDMQGFYGSGTAIPMGAVWGWRVLSPGEPFQQGGPYNDPDVNKVMIIMTDGENLIRPVSIFSCKPTNPDRYTSEYGGYGYTSEERLGAANINPVAASNELNNRLAAVCENIKAAGITIFTITFGDAVNDTIKGIMEACASSGTNIHAPSGESLIQAFRAIGAKLVNLRIAE